jgi:hypothetical protein
MNSIIKVLSITAIIVVFLFAILATQTSVFAFGGGGGDDCGSCGGGSSSGSGSGGSYTPPTPTPDPTPAVCNYLNGAPTSLPYGGGSVTLSWSTSNASSVSINNGVGSVGASGSTAVNVTGNTTFILTAVGAGGNDTCSVPVTVEAMQAPSCDAFSGTPNTLPYGGGDVTLNWATTNATNVSINNGVGSVAVDGSKVVAVTGNTTFTLTASNVAGSVTCTAPVTVASQGAPSCDAFSATPNTLPYGGGNVTLNWATTNATNISIDNGVGSNLAEDGSTSVAVNSSKTFTLTASNVAGSVTCTAPVTVQSNSSFSCDSFNIDKSSVEKGESFTITWTTTNADSVSINHGIGSVSADGSTTASTNEDRTYTLTATKGSQSVTCSDSVQIKSDGGGGGGGGSSSPRCELDISAKKITSGKEVLISWETTRATAVTLKDDNGKTIFTTDGLSSSEKKDFYDGEIKVRPLKDTTYTLTAEKGSKKRTCKVSVDVSNNVTVLESRDQKPLVSGIYLTQVPYTGFEAGPVLTFIFYTLLTLWALFIAYYLVVKKKVS